MGSAFIFSQEELDSQTCGYVVRNAENGKISEKTPCESPITFSEFFSTLSSSTHEGKDLRLSFTNELRSCPFGAFFFETPPFTSSSISSAPFAFVLKSAPRFVSMRADPDAFKEHIAMHAGTTHVSVFDNLGGDARLVVPASASRVVADNSCAHLANFVRNAPPEQIDHLWVKVGGVALELASEKPRWLSTAGGGVPWLHIRFDSRPKYYQHSPFKRVGAA